MSYNGQIHFKNPAVFAVRFLKCAWPFWVLCMKKLKLVLLFRTTFSKNGRPTIVLKKKFTERLGQPFRGDKLTDTDVGGLNSMYCTGQVTTSKFWYKSQKRSRTLHNNIMLVSFS